MDAKEFEMLRYRLEALERQAADSLSEGPKLKDLISRDPVYPNMSLEDFINHFSNLGTLSISRHVKGDLFAISITTHENKSIRSVDTSLNNAKDRFIYQYKKARTKGEI